MTQRDIATSVVEGLNRTASGDTLLPFLTLTHPDLAATVRVVSDHFNYQLDGNTYVGMPFNARPMTDGENAPFAELVVQNVDPTISQVLETAEQRANAQLIILSSIDFDKTQDPRTPITTPAKVYEYLRFELTQIEVTPAAITGRVSLPDYASEPWPSVRATEDKYPGVYA